jgi:hypothetical protein
VNQIANFEKWSAEHLSEPDEQKANRHDSFNSFSQHSDFDSYPQPLGEDAFYGIAGEIVRKIEPHTEADPAALLFQMLAAFGNVIGRNSYMMADGARHFLNLYGVLCGQSSKGRKGTSWNHIGTLLEKVDTDWREKCVTGGLSSGEGLIWNVRDPITETKPIKKAGRHTGEYEDVTTDQGISDKRLFVIEGEFANVLKVMSREGNTLSPVIRAAWDNGNLKTMVKNNPARATDAHVSLVGHITRDELRRLLTQTESANGFANRFCWLAVRRSKPLPDGGKIEQENFAGHIIRLKNAIKFGRTTGEIKRDESAREIWHEVYGQLSEGKPGMLGAVTGRAEAQVMRLSAIYALLDCSPVVSVEHQQAALALWDYCERSAQWIFGTSTGDRNADKIAVALTRAGRSGMTRTDISDEVFNKNLSRHDLAEALRLLNTAGLAKVVTEQTGGAPRERWFSNAQKHEINELSPR